MANYIVTDTELTSVADMIRSKAGTSASLSFPNGFVSAVEAIPAASGMTVEEFIAEEYGEIYEDRYESFKPQ